MEAHQHNPLPDREMEGRLWNYIDGLCDDREQLFVEQMIAENAEWRRTYQELLAIHQLLKLSELEQPSMRFTKNVMEEIAHTLIAPDTQSYINKKIIWAIAGFFLTLIGGLLLYIIIRLDWSTGSGRWLELDKIDFDYGIRFTSSYIYIFMMMNIVLALVLLDKFISFKKRKPSAEL